ncbi:hypothetical protein [Variovorax boronicumulans]|nr:hypothetical protein [Variovorax boronicumulans]
MTRIGSEKLALDEAGFNNRPGKGGTALGHTFPDSHEPSSLKSAPQRLR